jgi:hypothetical protein
MAISKKPPVPSSKPKKPEKPASSPDVVELAVDDISEDQPSTLMGVPMRPEVDLPAADPKPAPSAPEPQKPAAAAPPAEPPAAAGPAEVPALKTLIGVPALDPAQKKVSEPAAPPEPKDERASEPAPVPSPFAIPPSRLPAPLQALLDGPRPRLIAFASMAALVLFIFIGVIVRAVTSSPHTDTATTTAASASAVPSAAPVESTAPVASASSAPPPTNPVACTVTGEAHIVAPRAMIASGIEVVAIDSKIAIGFAKTATAAVTLELDPTTMAAAGANDADAAATIKRVTPVPSGKMAIDVDAPADVIRGRRRLVGDYDVGKTSGELVWAPHGTSTTTALWKLAGDAPVEATRGAAFEGGLAIAYRYDGAIWAGLAKGVELMPSAQVHVAGLGPQVGAPAIAAAAGKVIVAWADRADKNAPWGLRAFVWTEGTEAKAEPFTPPPGGLGENVMSPSLSALADGSFLLVWTEGPMAQQQVRARVLGSDGTPRGNAIEVSGAGIHAGQGRAAVLPDGRGVIAFLAAVGPAFEVRATAIRCVSSP